MLTQAAGPPAQDSGLELQHYVGIILERRYLLISLLAVGLALSFLWTASQTRIYEARASLLVEATVPQVLGSEVRDVVDSSPGNFYMMQEYLQTSRRVIMSDSLARRVAARLRLDREAEFWMGTPPPKTIEAAGERLLSHYSAEMVAETRLLVIVARHPRPAWAKRIADGVADEFVEGTKQRRDTSTQQASQQLADELDVLRKSLHSAEVALHEFKTRHDMLSVNLEDKVNQVARQIDKYTDALSEVRLRKLNKQSQLEELRRFKEMDPLHTPGQEKTESGTAMLTDLRRIYIEEERRLAELRARYQDNHPQVQQQASKVGLVLRELKREADVALAAADLSYKEAIRNEQKILAELEAVKQEGLRLNRLEIEYNKLKRQADSLQKHYTMVLNRTNEAGMVGRLKLNNVSVLDYARLPQVPVSPRLRIALLFGGLVSFIVAVLLIFILNALDRTVKSQEDVEGKLMLPFLGMLPRFGRGEESGVKGALPDLYVAQHPRSTVAEACRAIRTNVLFAGAERSLKKLLVTSSVAREGKTLACVSLGTTLAQSGARVLIIDADLRRPRIAKAFGMREPLGLTNVLVGDIKAERAIHQTSVENLSVMLSGPIPPNPAELLAGTHFHELLSYLSERYDRVLIDSPPAVPVTDPMVLASAVDGVVLVVRHSSTHREVVHRTARHIQDVGGRIIGVVLNDIDTEAKGYREYYGMYAAYYQSEDGDEERPEAKVPPRSLREGAG